MPDDIINVPSPFAENGVFPEPFIVNSKISLSKLKTINLLLFRTSPNEWALPSPNYPIQLFNSSPM